MQPVREIRRLIIGRSSIDSGFPFVTAELFRSIIPQVNADDCLKFLSLKGFDIRLLESSLADLEPADSEPPHPEIMPPPIKTVVRGWPGEVTIGAAAALATIPWQPRPGQARAVADQAKGRYTAAKLR